MPVLTIPNDFQPQTRIYSAEVDANFNAIATLLNTTGLDNTNIQNNGINPLTKIDTSGGTEGQILKKVGSQLAWASEQVTLVNHVLINLGLTAAVGSSALTITLQQQSGSALSASNPGYIGFRSSTATSGINAAVAISSNISLVVSAGSTLGQVSGQLCYTYVYAINNAGTIELAVSSRLYDDGSIVSTTAEGGAGAADSPSAMYSTSARSNVPCFLIGRIKSTQTVAGTWGTSPSEVLTAPWNRGTRMQFTKYDTRAGFGSTNTAVPYFTNATFNNVTGDALFAISNSSTTGFQITALHRCTLTFTLKVIFTGSGEAYAIAKSSTPGTAPTGTTAPAAIPSAQLMMLADESARGDGITVTVDMEIGDIIQPQTAVGNLGAAGLWWVNVCAVA